MAKLVPATCPKCGGSVQIDADREFVTCQFCGASSFIQTQKRPVTQQVYAQHMPVIHVTHPQKGCAPAVILLAVLGTAGLGIATVVGNCLAVGATSILTQPESINPAQAPVSPTPTGNPLAPTSDAQPSGPLVEEDYFADAARVKARYEKVLGKPIMAKSLVIYQYYATLEAQNPKNPDHVDSYKLWANKVERPEPVRLGSDKKQLSQLLFSLDSVDFKLVSKLIKQALVELKIEEGKVTHVYLERDSINAKRDPIWRVYVNGARDSGFIEFSSTGEKRRTAQ